MFTAVVDVSQELVNRIDTGRTFETRDLCNRYVCDVIGNVAFGLDCEALKNENSELLKAGDSTFRLKGLEGLRFIFVNSFIDFSRALNLRLLKAECSNYFIEAVRQAIKFREENNIKRPDFLNSLMLLQKNGTIDDDKIDNDKKLTFNQVVAEAFLFFLAG